MVLNREEQLNINLLVDEAIKLANHKISKMILFQRPGHEVKLNAPMEVSWDEVVSNASDADCVEMNSNELAYILIYIWNNRHS